MRIIRKAFFYIILISIFVFACKLISIPFYEYTDSLSLFNPVYMWANYGKLVYPVHGYFDNMPVHPPLYYYIQSVFFSITHDKYLASTIPIYAIFVYLFSAICFSYNNMQTKIIWVLPILFLLSYVFQKVRPELFLTLTFYTGIWHLQNSIKNKSILNLFLGSFFLSITSTLHYYASFTFIGVVPYVVYFYFKKNIENKALFLSIGIPVFVVIGFYLLFQVIPNFEDIYRQINWVYKDSGVLVSIKKHFIHYGIPPILFSVCLVFLNRKSRLLFYSSSPIILFVFFFSAGKSGDYYLVENTVFMLLSLLFIRDYLNVSKKKKEILIIIVSVFFLFFAQTSYCKNIYFKKIPNAIFLRKASVYMFGGNNKIAGRIDPWYISGANHYINISPYLLWNNSNLTLNDTSFFRNFDFTVETSHMSNNTTSPHDITISDYYLNQKMKVSGYLYSQNNYVSNLVFFTIKDKLFQSVVIDGEEVIYFKQDTANITGYFIAVKTLAENLEKTMAKMKYATPMALRNPLKGDYQMDKDIAEYIVYGYVPNSTDSLNIVHQVEEKISVSRNYIDKITIDTIKTPIVNFYDSMENFKVEDSYY